MDDNNGKKVDGIKKLSKDELKKSRQIVLDSIGEIERSASAAARPSTDKSLKKMDSIFARKVKDEGSVKLPKEKIVKPESEKKDIKQPLQISESKKKKWREEIKKLIPLTDQKIIKEKSELQQYKNSQADHRFKPDLDNKILTFDSLMQLKKKGESVKIPDKKTVKPNKINDVKTKLGQDLKPSKIGGVSFIDKKKHALREKHLEEVEQTRKREKKKKIEQIKRQKKIAEKKAKQARRSQKIKAIWKNFLNFLGKLSYQLKTAGKQTVYIILVALVLGLLFYSILAVLIIKFDLDNNLARKITKRSLIPAFITKEGIVPYYIYKDLKANMADNFNSADELEQGVKLAIANNLVISNLADKYNLSFVSLNSEELKQRINERIVYDLELNQVAINRINKVKQMIDENGDFVRVANKYSDEKGQININKENENYYSFSQEVKNLEVNEISDIVVTPEGYYIFRCYDKKDDFVALSYVFIKARGLEEYLEEAITNLKIWSLVN